ncbi:MAG: hypothetical protein EP315_05585 [Gammaproteobacteria bacterium]|nr:MAG: hypothetical protein EP315_05585 [Gammaproteobacteria bacterium]
MNQRDEQISALMDDALQQQELDAFLQDLKRDPVDEAERIKRYQMMGDVIRNEFTAASFMDISAAVQRAIDNEPEMEVSSQRTRRSGFDFSAWLRPLSGLAIAASVAMVTVVSVRMVETTPEKTAVQPIAAVQPVTSPATATLAPQLRQQIQVVSTDSNNATSPLTQKQLNDYLMNHSEYAGQTTMQGMMPYARVISFDAKTRQ